MAQHQIPFDTGEEERLLGPLSVTETLWIVGGCLASYNMAKVVPPLPLPNLFSFIHYLIPLGIAAAFAFIRYKDMTLMELIKAKRNFKKRNRRLMFDCQNILLERKEE